MSKLFQAAADSDPIEVLARLAAGEDVDSEHVSGQTALFKAAAVGSEQVLDELLGAGATVNKVDKRGQTALHMACNNGRARIVTKLVSWGADETLKDMDGEVPLDWALEPQRKARMQLAIARGKRLRANGSRVPPIRPFGTSSERGPPKLCTASEGSSASAVRRLLTDGAPVNESNSSGQASLLWAAWGLPRTGDEECIDLLIAAGADPTAQDDDGKTALHMAASYGKDAVAEALVAAGADPTAANDFGKTPIDLAMDSPGGKERADMIQRAIDRGLLRRPDGDGAAPGRPHPMLDERANRHDCPAGWEGPGVGDEPKHDARVVRVFRETTIVRVKFFGAPRADTEPTKMQTRLEGILQGLPPETYQRLVEILSKATQSDGLERLLDADSERVYSPKTGRRIYGDRGGEPYHKPMNWVRFNIAGFRKDDRKFVDWAVAYHGTAPDAILPIATEGFKTPAERGVRPKHGQCGAQKKKGHTIYTSPCINYSAHPVYTPLTRTESGFAQLVLQLRVDPSSIYKRLGSTLGGGHWPENVPFDLDFPTGSILEWLHEDSSKIMVTGILFREMGRDTPEDRARYGDAACDFKLEEFGPDPEYQWTTHLSSAIALEATA